MLRNFARARLASERPGAEVEGCDTPNFGALVAEVGDVQVVRRLPHGPLASTVVSGCGGGVGVSAELLHRGEVAYGVKEVPDEGLAEVVGRDLLYLGLPVAPLDRLVDCLVRERGLLLAVGVGVQDPPVLPHGREEGGRG